MLKRLPLVCIFLLLEGTMLNGNAASTIKLTCTGSLINTRSDGVTLGDCDLNFIAVKEMNEIEDTGRYPQLKINVEYEQLSHPTQVLP